MIKENKKQRRKENVLAISMAIVTIINWSAKL